MKLSKKLYDKQFTTVTTHKNVQSSKSMSVKSTEELCVMTMKNDAKFEEELTCQFKIGMRNLMNFDLST